jgi:signal transduction histidine kinase/ActR/RegA family two-component response regulator
VAEEPADISSWWSGVKPAPDVAERLAELALVRARVFLPIVMFAIVLALIVSEPSGIPVTALVLVVNVCMLALAIGLFVLLRAGRISTRWAHPLGSLVWLMTPITTLVSTGLTDAPTLTLPLMIELASLALLIETRWAIAASLPVVGAAFPLMAGAGTAGIYPIAVVGVWVVAMIMQIALRRSMIRSETNQLNLVSALEALRHELTERQRAEADREQLRDQFVHAQRMDAVGTLSAGLAHDMNNILGGILAFAEILKLEASDPQVKEDLDRIRQEAERGAALTRGLLAFSRRGGYRRRPIALGSVIEDMTPLLARTLGKSIELERDDGPHAMVAGDPAQLGQVLINLCLNGADAMAGEGTIKIATTVVERDGASYARLSVSDTGSGMDEATKKRMFEPFFTTKPVGKGTGLGLAMVYGAVEAHDGTIEVVSAPGAGTTVHVFLPITDAEPEQRKRADSQPSQMHGMVLIVDDEATMRAGAARIIETLGLTTTSASDGRDAVNVFAQHKDEIVLVLLDMAMPRMDGAACFAALRKLAPVPILLTSGYTDHTAAQELLAAGAIGFLEKPYTADQLTAELERVLGRR